MQNKSPISSRAQKNVVVAGALSLIAQETLRLLAGEGDTRIVLLARDLTKLQLFADDLKVRGAAEVTCLQADFLNTQSASKAFQDAVAKLERIDLLLIAWGTLGNDQSAQVNYAEAYDIFRANFLSVAEFLTNHVTFFEEQKSGTIAVISSVAGDRGRFSNYVYGSAKAGLSAFLQGYRARLSHHGVRVLTIKPGLIKTPMTAHVKHGLLSADAKTAGRGIYRALRGRGDVCYVPGYWCFVMAVIKAIPERIFKRLKL
jgi:decaprenylphospho-beta-D-erythro-pentofuranosid-2-ulose 2-reductase